MRYLILLLFIIGIGCSKKEAEPIKLNVDQCEFCKMKISDGKFASEVITTKGRVYKFDDLRCLVSYIHEKNISVDKSFVNDFSKKNSLISIDEAFFLKGGDISSPMRGNIAAFKDELQFEDYKTKLNATKTNWSEINNIFK